MRTISTDEPIEEIIKIWRRLKRAEKLEAAQQLQQLYDAEQIEEELNEETRQLSKDDGLDVEKPSQHSIVHGDITSEKTLRKIKEVLGNKQVGLVFTSPPYNNNVNYDNCKDNLSFSAYRDLLRKACRNCDSLLKPGGRFVINIRDIKLDDGSRFPALILFCGLLCKELSYGYRGQHIWYKGREESSLSWGSWRSSANPSIIDLYEWVLVFQKKGKLPSGKDNLGKTEFIESVIGVWKIRSVKKITGNKNKGKKNILKHPCPFPVELPRRAIKLYSQAGSTVLDPFAGVASTALAAHRSGRSSICVDISKVYCDFGYKRLEQEIIPGGSDMFGGKTIKMVEGF